MMKSFKALMVRETGGKAVARMETIAQHALPDEPVLVEISHSALNYKDALALQGNRNKVLKALPFIPGIDLVGRVAASRDGAHLEGDAVLATGWGLGERFWGAYTRFERLKPEWLTPLPASLPPSRAMALGTAGLTALLSVEAIEETGLLPGDGEILVTGAAGGVSGLSIILLSRRGYQVVAATGRPELSDYLTSLGAKRIISRDELSRDPRPLEKELWSAVVDTVGSKTLATALAQTRYGGIVAACGLAGGFDLPGTVMPFILRGVRLQGIDSVYLPAARRPPAWARLIERMPVDALDRMTAEVPLDGVIDLSADLLAGKVRGRLVVALPA
jgi:putative YhdH/YhfP family quinone oxidoreductase